MIDTPIRVAGELVVRLEDMPDVALAQAKQELSFDNEERQAAEREQAGGWWEMPELLEYFRVEERRSGETVVVFPRGFALRLGQILTESGSRPVFDDQRVAPASADGYFRPFVLRDYQLDAVLAMMKAQQGFVQAPAGAGKSVIMLGLLPYLGLKTLIIMDKADIVDQWREKAEQFLGLPTDFDDPRSTGKIGMDIWEERDLTICLRQTLWSRIDMLDGSRWWDQWGVWIADEAQHLAAATVSELSRRCSSQYMFGTSATPARTPMKGKIVEAIVGPVIHRVPRKLLRERGILIKPVVRVVKTNFTAAFWPTHDSDFEGNCEKPGCTKKNQHMHRNPYSSVLKKLTEDKTRNKMIADAIVAEHGHVHLVPSRQLKHLDALRKAIEAAGWDGPIFFLRGEENARGESRDIVRAIHEADEAVILSTVADEALDVPPIDRVWLAFPMRQSAATEQLIGRCERSHEGKQGAVVVDIVDEGCEPLLNQSFERSQTYARLELDYESSPAADPEDEGAG